ncbi:hypothetical protein Godav_020999 [Gossypium davidsonii]|uniref:DUF4283 domain-containing protein n=1 Tax=Gossypium davidsonii TaxID=34287 RepID=A0A7J8R4R7_GOSDV|nr:hypothetical protein [Gossypium davidsonii]
MSENLFVVDASPTTSNIGIGRATKKNGVKILENDTNKTSYKNTLIGNSFCSNPVLKEEAFALQEGDVLTEMTDGIPSITYLRVRPWSPNFSTTQNEIDNQAVWVRLPGLPKGYYSDFLLKAIGQTIGPILKIHDNIDSARMGHFARLAICVDLRKPLVSKIKINGRIQHLEYELLPNIGKGMLWPLDVSGMSIVMNQNTGVMGNKNDNNQGVTAGGSQFNVLDSRFRGKSEQTMDKNNKASNSTTYQKKNNLKAKGKGISVASGLQTNLNILKPNNTVNGLSSSSGQGLVDDGKKRNIGESCIFLELSKSKDITSKNTGQEPLSMDAPRSQKPPDVGASRSEHIMLEDNILMETIDVEDSQNEKHMDWFSSLTYDDSRVDDVIEKLGFQNSFKIEAIGFSWGIWLLWSDNIKVDAIDLHSQMFLDSIASSVKEPWILAGDFNSILDSLEHDGGVIRVKASCNFFKDFLVKNKLRDMDPRPILVNLGSSGHNHQNTTCRPFKFIASWLLHPEFGDLELERVTGILEVRSSSGLQAREFELCQEIEEVLKHECHIPKLGLEVWRVVLELWLKIGFENS